jgi:hypothetical protein
MYNQAFNRRGMFGRGPGPFAPPGLAQPQLLGDVPKMPMPDPNMGMGQAEPQMGMAPPQRQGGGLRRIAGIASDFLSGMNGGQANYAISQERAMQQQQEAQAQLAARDDERRYQAGEWDRRQAFERANPEPRAPSEFERTLEAAGIMPGTPRYIEMMTMRARNQAEGAPLTVSNGDGTYTVVPRAQLYGGQGAPAAPASPTAPSGPPAGTVRNGYRFRGGNPNDRANWEPAGGQPTGGPRPFEVRGVQGETVTSRYRTPEHNRRVGGVPNSYHTRRGANGQAMARDSVPPPGVSMSEYAAMIRRQNPHLRVINEGDHVHTEPR